ncbi:uncharacterized protein LOC144353451, partial [Saccoglossus kowalevskii]
MAAPIVNIVDFPRQRSAAVLLCHPTMNELAEAVADKCNELVMESSIASGAVAKVVILLYCCVYDRSVDSVEQSLGRQASRECQKVKLKKLIRWEQFPDGWPNLFIEDIKECHGSDIIFIGSIHSPQVVFEQLSILYNIPRKLTLKNFNKTVHKNVLTLATLLSAIPYTARGPAQLMIYDIHALQERFYFSDGVIP